MVWIHGGGFVTGSARDYDPHVLAEQEDVIVVTINYRLGALGFVSHPALGQDSGNVGLLDQQEALRWVQRNISALEGDASRVTIFGESAGGVTVCGHLRAPGSAGLFSRAIDQSGPCVGVPRVMADARGETFASEARCPAAGEAAVECLRRIPAQKVAATSPGATAAGDTPWAPVAGTSVLPHNLDHPDAVVNKVPFLNGSNGEEGNLFALANLEQLRSSEDYARNARLQFGSAADRVQAEYPASSYPSPALAYAAYTTDFLFACQALTANSVISRHMPVYAYEFNEQAGRWWEPAPKEIGTLGAHHAKEIEFIFQTPSFFGGPADFSPEQKRLSDQMMSAWADFARHGTPMGDGTGPWQPTQPESAWVKNLDTGGPLSVPDFAEQHNCDFWASL